MTSQGCADGGICYPPAEHVVHVDGAALKAAATSSAASPAPAAQSQSAAPALPTPPSPVTGADSSSPAPATTASPAPAPSADGSWYDRVTSADYAQSLLEGHGFLTIVALFFVAGMVLSLLPCSYPMIPILSAIIIGEGTQATRARGFMLSLTYVVGMALVYTVLGIAAALVGQSLGAWLQNPWVLGAFGLLLTAFALTLIGGIDIALPQRWQDGAAQASSRRSGGRFLAVAAMGALSALVVGACMTAPLFAVLAFIAHTGNALLGGAALFAMGIGLGVPLLIIGLGAGTLLPRAGAWMDGVKVFFGVVLLAAALWIVWPVLGASWQMRPGRALAADRRGGPRPVHADSGRHLDLAPARTRRRRGLRDLGRRAAGGPRGRLDRSAASLVGLRRARRGGGPGRQRHGQRRRPRRPGLRAGAFQYASSTRCSRPPAGP